MKGKVAKQVRHSHILPNWKTLNLRLGPVPSASKSTESICRYFFLKRLRLSLVPGLTSPASSLPREDDKLPLSPSVLLPEESLIAQQIVRHAVIWKGYGTLNKTQLTPCQILCRMTFTRLASTHPNIF